MTKARLSHELPRVTADLARAAGLLLQPGNEARVAARAALRLDGLLDPGDELVDGEAVGERRGVAAVGGRAGGGGGAGGLGWGSSGAGAGGGLRRAGGAALLGGLGGGRAGAAGAGAVPDGRAGDLVGSGVVVDVDEDAWVGGAVGLRQVGAGGEGDGAAGDAELAAAVVELGAALAVALVQADDLGADQVLAVGEVGQSDGDEALVLDEGVDAPDAAVEALLPDLGPDGTLAVALGGRDVDHDGALVGRGDGLVAVARRGHGVVVVPLEADLRAGRDLDELVFGGAAVADHGRGGDIVDGVVGVGGGLNGEVLALVLAVDDDGLEGGVAGDELGRGERESNGGLHGDGAWFSCCIGILAGESVFSSGTSPVNE